MSEDTEAQVEITEADGKGVEFRLRFAAEVWPRIGSLIEDFVNGWKEAGEPEVSGEEVIIALQMLVGNLVNRTVAEEAKPYVVRNLVVGLSKQTGMLNEEQTNPANDD